MESILYSVDDFSAFLWEDSIKELITADDRSSDTDSNTVDTSGVGESQPYTNTEVEFQEPLKRFLDGNWQTGNSPNSSTISIDILFPETQKNYVMLPVRNLDAWTDTSVVREIKDGTVYTLLLWFFINQPSCTYIGLRETNQYLNTRKDKRKTPSLKEVWTVAEYKGVWTWMIWFSFW